MISGFEKLGRVLWAKRNKEYRKSCSDKEQSEKVYHITAELKLN